MRDLGTLVVDEVLREDLHGTPVSTLTITYEADVGTDTWLVSFDSQTKAMVGYRFFHETADDGEWIALSEEIKGAGLRLPAARAWYTSSDEEHLGTDTLVKIELVE